MEKDITNNQINPSPIETPQEEIKSQPEAVLGVTGEDKGEDKDIEKPLKDGEPLVKRDERGRILAGSILNPNGYTKGVRNFNTDFDEVVEEIAQENNITVSQARKRLLKVAYKQANDGVFQYHKDIHDRVYGKPKETHELMGKDGEPIKGMFEINIINGSKTDRENQS
jgi:hypothetical protein